jgi:four helix bundle protein
MKVRDFQDLIVWQKAVDLIVEIYRATRHFPADERFQISGQLRKAAVSIASNIAEGNGRGTTRDYVNFLTMSRGSLQEVRSLLIVSQRLELISGSSVTGLFDRLDEIGKMLSALRTSLSRRIAKPLTPSP